MALTVTLDKAVYNPGDPMTLTVACAPEDRDRYIETPFTVQVSVPGTGTGSATANLRQQVAEGVRSAGSGLRGGHRGRLVGDPLARRDAEPRHAGVHRPPPTTGAGSARPRSSPMAAAARRPSCASDRSMSWFR